MEITDFRTHPWLDESFPLSLDMPFTTRMAREAGIRPGLLRELTALGLLRHPIRGCYIAAQAPNDISTRARCLALVTPRDAVIVDRHAGWLHGADMVLRPNEHLETMPIALFRPDGRGRLRNQATESGERSFREEDLVEVQGLLTTTPLRTACDLGRQRWPESALIALDALHRLGKFSVEQLVDGVERFRGMRWVTTLRQMAPYTDGRSQSGGETVLRWRWLNLPVPPPEPQVQVHSNGRLAFIDVGQPDLRCGVEYDGQEWHTGEAHREHDRRRREWLRQDADWLVVPLVKEDLYGPKSCVEEVIVDLVAQARKRLGA